MIVTFPTVGYTKGPTSAQLVLLNAPRIETTPKGTMVSDMVARSGQMLPGGTWLIGSS